MYGELIPYGGGDAIPLQKSKVVIGRRSSCDIILDFPNVSSQHCLLEFVNGYWYVRDLHSRNGVKINGERCDTRWIQPSDQLSVASHRFSVNYTPTKDAPAPVDENPFALSLMEKAGLMRRKVEREPSPLAPSSRPMENKPPVKVPGKHAHTLREEEEALKWLTEGEDE